jgi:hypothetical protein
MKLLPLFEDTNLERYIRPLTKLYVGEIQKGEFPNYGEEGNNVLWEIIITNVEAKYGRIILEGYFKGLIKCSDVYEIPIQLVHLDANNVKDKVSNIIRSQIIDYLGVEKNIIILFKTVDWKVDLTTLQ